VYCIHTGYPELIAATEVSNAHYDLCMIIPTRLFARSGGR